VRLRYCHFAKQITTRFGTRFGNVSKKLIGLGERDNFFDEVRRIKSKMYLS